MRIAWLGLYFDLAALYVDDADLLHMSQLPSNTTEQFVNDVQYESWF